MQFDILLTKHPSNGYTARPVLLPEIVVHADDEDEALSLVSEAIADLQHNSRIVRIEVQQPQEADDPWLRFAGMWADDPDWEIFQKEVKAFRQALDEQSQTNDKVDPA
jgi:predicted RNase H-like HicB family nuclease